jgi:hypothetical protein
METFDASLSRKVWAAASSEHCLENPCGKISNHRLGYHHDRRPLTMRANVILCVAQTTFGKENKDRWSECLFVKQKTKKNVTGFECDEQ